MYKSFIINQPTFGFIDEKLEIKCSYSFDNTKTFEENFTFNFGEVKEIFIDDIPRYLELVAISGAPSYFKAAPTSQIVIDFPVTTQVTEWASALFDEGLRELDFKII